MNVISRTQLPTYLPIIQPIVWWLLLDRLNASPTIWGVYYTLYAIVWILCLVVAVKQKQVKIEL